MHTLASQKRASTLLGLLPNNVCLAKSKVPLTHRFNNAFDDYMAACETACLIVDNTSDTITQHVVRQVLCAIYKQKPIILMRPPTFTDSIHSQTQTLITDKLSKIYIGDLTVLDKKDAHAFVQDVTGKTINYALTNSDKQLIAQEIKHSLRTFALV